MPVNEVVHESIPDGSRCPPEPKVYPAVRGHGAGSGREEGVGIVLLTRAGANGSECWDMRESNRRGNARKLRSGGTRDPRHCSRWPSQTQERTKTSWVAWEQRPAIVGDIARGEWVVTDEHSCCFLDPAHALNDNTMLPKSTVSAYRPSALEMLVLLAVDVEKDEGRKGLGLQPGREKGREVADLNTLPAASCKDSPAAKLVGRAISTTGGELRNNFRPPSPIRRVLSTPRFVHGQARAWKWVSVYLIAGTNGRGKSASWISAPV